MEPSGAGCFSFSSMMIVFKRSGRGTISPALIQSSRNQMKGFFTYATVYVITTLIINELIVKSVIQNRR